MKRGFLLRAAEKEKAAADRRNCDPQAVPQNISKPRLLTRREGMCRVYDMIFVTDLDFPPEFRLPYGNLTEQQKGGNSKNLLCHLRY